MKIKKLIKLLECIEGDNKGKLSPDMYKLGTYRNSEGLIDIEDMDFVHIMRSFKKSVIYDEGLQQSVSDANQISKLEKKVSELYADLGCKDREISFLKDTTKDLFERLEKKSYRQVTAPLYMFSEIPNNDKGWRMIEEMKDTLNKSRYTIRVRGQHVREEYKGTGATAYGQNIEQSTHLRVYIEEK